MIKAKIFIRLLGTGLCLIPMAIKAEWNGSVQLGGGYESNLYRRPSELDTARTGVALDPTESDGILGGKALVQYSQALNDANRIKVLARTSGNVYPSHSSSSEGEWVGAGEYRYRPNAEFNIRLLGSGGYLRQLTVDETVDEAAALYKYLEYTGGAKAAFSGFKSMTLEGGYLFTLRDYAAPKVGQSLDNQQHEATLAATIKLGADKSKSLGIEGAYLIKKYRDLLSYDAQGVTAATYPPRTYQYFTGQIEFKSERNGWQWKLSERPRYRTDDYAGYYTYFENRIGLGLGITAWQSWNLGLDFGWRYRNYLTHEALRPGTNPLLVMQYVDLGLKVKRELGKNFSLFATYALNQRLTNTGYTYLKSYRDYTDHTVMAGAEWLW